MSAETDAAFTQPASAHVDALAVTGRVLGLASNPNLRDIGGYQTADGQRVLTGVVYRSGALTLSAADLAVVNALGITGAYDLQIGRASCRERVWR